MYEVKTSSRHKKDNKLRWLATNINFNSYTLGVLTLMLCHSKERQDVIKPSPQLLQSQPWVGGGLLHCYSSQGHNTLLEFQSDHGLAKGIIFDYSSREWSWVQEFDADNPFSFVKIQQIKQINLLKICEFQPNFLRSMLT